MRLAPQQTMTGDRTTQRHQGRLLLHSAPRRSGAMLEQEHVPLEHLPEVMRDAIEDVAHKTMAPRSMIKSAATYKKLLEEARGKRCVGRV